MRSTDLAPAHRHEEPSLALVHSFVVPPYGRVKSVPSLAGLREHSLDALQLGHEASVLRKGGGGGGGGAANANVVVLVVR